MAMGSESDFNEYLEQCDNVISLIEQGNNGGALTILSTYLAVAGNMDGAVSHVMGAPDPRRDLFFAMAPMALSLLNGQLEDTAINMVRSAISFLNEAATS
jgi:hypothetical protein